MIPHVADIDQVVLGHGILDPGHPLLHVRVGPVELRTGRAVADVGHSARAAAGLRKRAVGERIVEVVQRRVPVGRDGIPGRALPVTLAISLSKKGRHVVEAEAGSDHQLIHSLIGEPEPRSEVFPGRVVKSAPGAADAIVNDGAQDIIAERRADRIGGGEVEIVLLIEALHGRGLVFPAHAQIQRELASDFPVVLEVDAIELLGGERLKGDAGGAARPHSEQH